MTDDSKTHTAITRSLVSHWELPLPSQQSNKTFDAFCYDFQLISSAPVKEPLYVNWLKLQEEIIISPKDMFNLIISDFLSFYACMVIFF